MKILQTIDEEAFIAKLNLLADQHSDSNDLRREILCLLKETHQQGLAEAENLLNQDGGGTLCARRISHLMDVIICGLYNLVTTRIYPVNNPSMAETMAIVAVGGYGRGGLAPQSDIDLLFLLPYKQTPWGEQVVEYILYMLWDMKLKVGHATRNIDDTIRLSLDDMTIRTAVLEKRFLIGTYALFEELEYRFENDVVAGTGPEFIAAKLHERDLRHQKSGVTRYLVEPNVKESKGGQRDLQTLFWIARYFYGIRSSEGLVKLGVLSRPEHRLFNKAKDFLWAVRCHMHFLTKRATERLSFELQPDIAERLGYTAHPGQNVVERFMKHYFLVAKDVGDLTRIICAALEEQQVKQVPGYNQNLMTSVPHKRKPIRGTDFVDENHRINIARDSVFQDDPVNIIRLFHLADKHGLALHPVAMQQVSRSLKLIKTELREEPLANKMFLEIVTSPRDPALILRRMNETGVLGKFVPDFGRIVAMMQFNMYHHYTVDEHLLRSIKVLSEIEHGTLEEEHPLSNELMASLKTGRTILYVALFLHDIAKGRPEAHSVAGARIARKLCPRFGLTPSETDTVAWLIEQHLTMSKIAQSRDLNDRKTIQDFADIVHTKDRLKLLLILTVCDIKAVGPGVWNGWKGQLLRTLYYETELVLTGGFSEQSRTERGDAARQLLASNLEHWPEDAIHAYIPLLYTNYLLSVPLEDQVRHADFIRKADLQQQPVATIAQPHRFEAVTEITVLAPDSPRLLTIITGACAAAGANIVDAQIFTTRDGRALDTILISRAFELDADERRRAERVGRLIEDALAGIAHLPDVMAKKAKPKRAPKTFRIEPRVVINNSLSNKFTVVEVKGLDRPGLLWELTGVISDLSLNIGSAHITTFGEKVIDTFYVTDLSGEKVTSATKENTIKRKLLSLLNDEKAA